MPKGQRQSRGKRPTHDPLGKQIQDQQQAKQKAVPIRRGAKRANEDEMSDEEEINDLERTQLPTDLARHEMAIDEDEEMVGDEEEEDDEDFDKRSALSLAASSNMSVYSEMPDIEVDPEQDRIFNTFLPESALQTRNLADIIMEKIKEKERDTNAEKAEARSQAGEGGLAEIAKKFDPKVVKVYKAVGRYLSGFKSGKVPKALKILPNLKDWEDLLMLTHPENWTPHAVFAVTRVFASNLNERMAIRFFRAFLLPSVRQWMKFNTSLAPPLYWALFKALFKPAAFMKGFFLPLCEEGDVNLREALIIGSVLQKKSIPGEDVQVVLLRLSRLPYAGANSIFIRVLLDKGYKLAYTVIDSLVRHFHTFLQEDRQLPVLWHQSLLCFIQRYKEALVDTQIQIIRSVLNKHTHYLITSEIRREIAPIVERINKEKAAATAGSVPAHKINPNASAYAAPRK